MVQPATVRDQTDVVGTFDISALEQEIVRVRLADARIVLVPAQFFHAIGQDEYKLPFAFSQIHEGQIVIPVHQEIPRVETQLVERGQIHINKEVVEQEEVIHEDLLREDVTIERIPINSFVDDIQSAHYEGDVYILPVYEEVMVVEKRIRLKEEVRITKRQNTETKSETVKLRQEIVSVERKLSDESKQ